MDGKYLVDIEEIKEVVDLANPRVKRGTTIETPDTIGQDVLYHIALDRRPTLFPNISKRAGNLEDNTLPRVHMSMNLSGCWFGYAGGGDLAAQYIVNDKKGSSGNNQKLSPYKGGFYIHSVPFRAGLRPNLELVYDADFTDEIWLITYNKMSVAFKTTIIGLMYTKSVTYIPRTGKGPVEITTICINIERGQSMHFTADNKYFKPNLEVPAILKEGFYQFDISDQFGIKNFKKITPREFKDGKLKSAGMLNF